MLNIRVCIHHAFNLLLLPKFIQFGHEIADIFVSNERVGQFFFLALQALELECFVFLDLNLKPILSAWFTNDVFAGRHNKQSFVFRHRKAHVTLN